MLRRKVLKSKRSKKNAWRFLLALCIIAVLGFVMFRGISIGIYDIGKVQQHLHYGLDLTGGVNVVLQADSDDADGVTAEKMEATIAAITKRVDTMGVTNATVAKQGEDRIRVSIPSIQDQQEALEMIGKTAQLEFVGPDGNVILTGKDVIDSKAVKNAGSTGIEKPVVTLKFNDDGTKLFAEATEKFIGQTIKIKLDDDIISEPVVNVVITQGEAIIEGLRDMNEAGRLAELIRGGALPLKMSPLEVKTIGPTLGQDSLIQSAKAGLIGIIGVFIFMLVFYRGLGMVADIALLVFIMFNFYLMTALNVVLTLPGIAGMILSVGMAVDANVIIFERIKDEARTGRSLGSAIDAGFGRAMTTIMDSNITTLIAGIVLYVLGTGSVQGFAVTLVLGIVISLLTAVVLTKQLIKWFVGAEFVESEQFYGI